MSSHSAPALPGHTRSSVAFNLVAIAAFALLLAVGAAYLVDRLSRGEVIAGPALTDGDPIVQTISGRELSIPRSWFRYGEQTRNGFTDQIDLRIRYRPAGAEAALPIDITLLPRSRARSSASLLDRVYLHQFGDATLQGVPGLVGKPMLEQNGYAGENVWYDALSPAPFVAKCQAPVTPETSTQCVRTVYLPSGIAAIYTFDADVLQSWRNFDQEIQRWLAPIGAW